MAEKTTDIEKLLPGRRVRDLTFSDIDIIRIACLNLTRKELRNVILFFMIGVPLILLEEQLELLLLSIKLPKTLILLIEKVLFWFIGDSLIELLVSWGFRFDVGDLEVLGRIIKRLQNLFPR